MWELDVVSLVVWRCNNVSVYKLIDLIIPCELLWFAMSGIFR